MSEEDKTSIRKQNHNLVVVVVINLNGILAVAIAKSFDFKEDQA